MLGQLFSRAVCRNCWVCFDVLKGYVLVHELTLLYFLGIAISIQALEQRHVLSEQTHIRTHISQSLDTPVYTLTKEKLY